jgi:uncharacterized protein
MDQRILEFIRDLRRAEIRISPSESLDALAAAAEIDLSDRAAFKAALATTLIKEGRALGTFEQLFDMYFPDVRAFGERLREALGAEESWIESLIERLLAEGALELDEVTELLLAGRGAEMRVAVGTAGLERLMRLFQVGDFSRQIYERLDWSAIERDVTRILERLEARGLTPDEVACIRHYLELRLEAFRRLIRQRVEQELARQAFCAGEKVIRDAPAGKAFSALTAEEIAEMKAVVAQLARKIKDALALRHRRTRKGRIDARRTIRKNLQYGGVPMEIALRHRRRERPNVVTICDVSDSVGYAARFMLQLVWSLQECFSRVRSYVFVSEIADVTRAFKQYPVERAIEWALHEAPIDYHGQSDFGSAFSRFARAELDGVDSKTTILVLGDARNNYRDPQEWALRQIRARAKGVIWLNPQDRREWGLADSVMPLYAPSCDLARECRTIAQLAEVIEGLVPHWWRGRG